MNNKINNFLTLMWVITYTVKCVILHAPTIMLLFIMSIKTVIMYLCAVLCISDTMETDERH